MRSMIHLDIDKFHILQHCIYRVDYFFFSIWPWRDFITLAYISRTFHAQHWPEPIHVTIIGDFKLMNALSRCSGELQYVFKRFLCNICVCWLAHDHETESLVRHLNPLFSHGKSIKVVGCQWLAVVMSVNASLMCTMRCK